MISQSSGPQDWGLSIILYRLFDRKTPSEFGFGLLTIIYNEALEAVYCFQRTCASLPYLLKAMDDVIYQLGQAENEKKTKKPLYDPEA
jgi:hypothetical protein